MGIDILSNATMSILKPFKKALETDLAWIATQLVRQYRLGKYDEREFTGYDKKDSPFKVKVNPEAVTERPFECELIMDLIRDRVAEIGTADTLLKTGMASVQTARDISGMIEDPDSEAEKVAKEKARALFGIGELEAFTALVKDYAKTNDPAKMFMIQIAWRQLQQALMSQGQPGGSPQPGAGGQPGMPVKPQTVTKGAMSSRTAQPNVPGPVREAARLKSMGM